MLYELYKYNQNVTVAMDDYSFNKGKRQYCYIH